MLFQSYEWPHNGQVRDFTPTETVTWDDERAGVYLEDLLGQTALGYHEVDVTLLATRDDLPCLSCRKSRRYAVIWSVGS